jgi:hypothetical protein
LAYNLSESTLNVPILRDRQPPLLLPDDSLSLLSYSSAESRKVVVAQKLSVLPKRQVGQVRFERNKIVVRV